MHLQHIALAIAVAVIWGAISSWSRRALDELPPILLCALRFFFAAFPAVFFIQLCCCCKFRYFLSSAGGRVFAWKAICLVDCRGDCCISLSCARNEKRSSLWMSNAKIYLIPAVIFRSIISVFDNLGGFQYIQRPWNRWFIFPQPSLPN